jgi:hypothetical protein
VGTLPDGCLQAFAAEVDGAACLSSEFNYGAALLVTRGAVGAEAQKKPQALGVVCASRDMQRRQCTWADVVGVGAHVEQTLDELVLVVHDERLHSKGQRRTVGRLRAADTGPLFAFEGTVLIMLLRVWHTLTVLIKVLGMIDMDRPAGRQFRCNVGRESVAVGGTINSKLSLP